MTSGGAADFAAAATLVLGDLRRRLGLDHWWVARRDGDDHVVLAVAEPPAVPHHVPGAVTPWRTSFCRMVARGGAPAAVGRVALRPDVASAYAAHETGGVVVGATLSVQLLSPAGQVLGTVCGVGREEVPDLEELLPAVRVQAAALGLLLHQELALAEEARRAERAERAAATDPLTGLANRRAWDAAVRAEESRARRHATTAAVVVLDVDGLKERNDHHGHAAGDLLLQQVATLVAGRVRARDLVARLGGDEFGLLLPGTDAAGARRLAEDLRAALRGAGAGVSVGVAARRRPDDLAEAWARADAAMYAEKAARRGRGAPAAPAPTAVAAPAPAPAATSPRTAFAGAAGDDPVDALLATVREQLGADLAYVSTLVDTGDGAHRRLRNLVSPHPLPVAVGHVEPLDGSLCQTVATTREPVVVPDLAAAPWADSRGHRAWGLRSYVGVPLLRRDGSLYGTLCTVSLRPDPQLRERDAGVLQAVAGAVVELAEGQDREDDARRAVRRRLDDLRAAGGPRMVFQPVVDLATGASAGVEALSRFPDGTPPDRWFADAAAAGAGQELELAAARAALPALDAQPGFLALNASPATVLAPAFARLLAPLPLGRVVVEITEHVPVDDYSALRAALAPLRAAGLRVAVDDTGAGYASMRHVLALVPDLLKLDVSLVRDLDGHPPQRALVAAMAAFAASTGARTVAEGVETAAELAVLRELGVDLAQGYHLARPGPLPAPAPEPAVGGDAGQDPQATGGASGSRRARARARSQPRAATHASS